MRAGPGDRIGPFAVRVLRGVGPALSGLISVTMNLLARRSLGFGWDLNLEPSDPRFAALTTWAIRSNNCRVIISIYVDKGELNFFFNTSCWDPNWELRTIVKNIFIVVFIICILIYTYVPFMVHILTKNWMTLSIILPDYFNNNNQICTLY